jgi:hypothetical protein
VHVHLEVALPLGKAAGFRGGAGGWRRARAEAGPVERGGRGEGRVGGEGTQDGVHGGVQQERPTRPSSPHGQGVGADRDRAARLLAPNTHVARSYVAGAVPGNGYAFDEGAIVVKFRPQAKMAGSVASGERKVFVWSGGADTARPVTLRCNAKGFWKVAEFSSLTVGVRPPQASGPTAADEL